MLQGTCRPHLLGPAAVPAPGEGAALPRPGRDLHGCSFTLGPAPAGEDAAVTTWPRAAQAGPSCSRTAQGARSSGTKRALVGGPPCSPCEESCHGCHRAASDRSNGAGCKGPGDVGCAHPGWGGRGCGTPVRGCGTPVRGCGAPVRGRGTSVRGRGTSVRGRGTPVRGRGTPVRGRGAPVRGHGALLGPCSWGH